MPFIAEDIYCATRGLLGSRCQACGEVFFPKVKACANCASQDVVTHALGYEGTLWSWTVQRFPPKAPYDDGLPREQFKPFGVGLVEMAGGVKIKARVRLSSNTLRVGERLVLGTVLLRHQADGSGISTYEFSQVEIA
ncbi:MAG: OB-fold domain-containing protein [Pseudomonadota bacterium]